MTETKWKNHAVVTIYNAANMHEHQRKDIVRWLRRHADDLEKLGPQYTNKFRGSYKSALA